MQKYFDSVFGSTGYAIPNASVTVLLFGTSTPASIFSDAAGTAPKANPITTDASGYFEFYAADGRYSLSISATGFGIKSITDVLLDDPANVNADNATQVAVATNTAASKTTPVDTDEIPLADSAASFGLKKLTWANLKATAKTYFDTLYQAALVSGTSIKTVNGTTLLGSGNLVVSTDLTAPGAIGSVTPSTAAFTTLSATSTVSGAGFTARFATPGPIGSTTPSTGAFTALSTTGTHTADAPIVCQTQASGFGAIRVRAFSDAYSIITFYNSANNAIWGQVNFSGVGAGSISGPAQNVLSYAENNSIALQGATVKTGTGITFPATQSPSTDVNTLDDYEEGTWTPAITGGTLTTNVATYTKIGNRVLLTMDVTINSVSAGSIAITGIPFSASGIAVSAVGGDQFDWSTALIGLSAYLATTEIWFFYLTSGTNGVRLTNANIRASTTIRCSFQYRI